MTSQKNSPRRGAFRHMAEGIFQYESSGAYYARFRHKGERIFERLGNTRHPCTSLPEAKRLLRELKNDLERTDVTARKKRLHPVIEEYRGLMDFSEGTMRYKNLYLDKLKEYFAEGKKMDEIKNSDILGFLSEFKGRAASTINHAITVSRDLFRYAIENGILSRSPMEHIKYKTPKQEHKRLVPSFEEFSAIVSSVRSQKFSDTAKESSDLIEFIGLAGMGQAECAGLLWGDINFRTSLIEIIRMKTGQGFSIPIFPQLLPLLERMDAERGEERLPTQKVFKISNPKKALEAACARLKFPSYTARAFRRMFITLALERGIDPQTIASWQGHRDGGQLILKVYGRVTKKHQQNMAALMTSPSSCNERK